MGQPALARHGPGPTWLEMGLDLLDSRWARVDLTQHGLVRLGSTSAWANSALHRPEPTRLHIDPDRLISTLTRTDSTWARADLARHGSELTQFDMGPNLLSATSTLFNFSPD